MKLYEFGPERRAQVYALISWNGKTMDEAIAMVESTSFEELDKEVYSAGSIEKAKAGIEAHKKELCSDKQFDAVIAICDEIHDHWVASNAKKYDRGNSEKSEKKIYQHLPTALIGMDEVALDLMFLAPFLEEMGIDAGVMSKDAYGAFVPSKEVEAAYKDFVKEYKRENKISTVSDLKKKLPAIIENYQPLQQSTEVGEKRVEYMNVHIATLTKQVEANNPKEFYRENVIVD